MNISYDIHAHTQLSLCAEPSATIESYVRSAERNGLSLIGIADHMWDPAIPFADSMYHGAASGDTRAVTDWYYKTQTIERCETLRNELPKGSKKPIFLFGGEVEYCPHVGAAITPKNAARLDFLIVPNSHTHMIMDKASYEPYSAHADFMLKATMEICTAPTAKYVTSLAHPFDAVCCPYDVDFVIDALTDNQLHEVFSAAAENRIAAEINAASFEKFQDQNAIRNSGLFRVLCAAKAAGCRFTFGSDSHSDKGQDILPLCATVSTLLGLSEKDIVSPIELIESAQKRREF